MLGLFCHAQNELYAIDKSDGSKQMRIAKGSFLRIKTANGKKYSGTLVKVKDFTIEMIAYSATIDIEEIVSMKIRYKKGGLSSLPIGLAPLVYQSARVGRVDLKYWKLIIKAG